MWVDDKLERYWRNRAGKWEILTPNGSWVAAQPTNTLRKLDESVQPDEDPPVAVIPTPHGSQTVVTLPEHTFIELQGDSAYEVAVKNGFIGTEEEWLESLQGEPGPGSPFVVMTQEAYDALPVKDPNTVYICTE